ncbi:hypothetical protein LVB77_03505 [Lysobacter sp. 5GHs7-4]|uniref:hypothetical protein n=1 Tax=Lysobacter sp. 5GHs7-4 TaxID=2904253 RepID=UPI001E4A7CE5|nr:hypothetical protein [Lysobacter sp. 5GHs7-4]UHQ23790.1 hypothetical protein LVB77_03505 [Lysobacter sp. 5GHs7-4]
MSDSYIVRAKSPIPLDAGALCRETERALQTLLARDDRLELSVRLLVSGAPVRAVVVPAADYYVLEATGALRCALLIAYRHDPDQDAGPDIPAWQFVVTEVPRRRDDAVLALCAATCIGAARLLGSEVIVDYSGVLGTGDEVPLSRLLAAAARTPMPLGEALAQFYSRLPV